MTAADDALHERHSTTLAGLVTAAADQLGAYIGAQVLGRPGPYPVVVVSGCPDCGAAIIAATGVDTEQQVVAILRHGADKFAEHLTGEAGR